MSEPQIPGAASEEVELPCGRSVPVEHFDMGMREIDCACGTSHAVIMDVHPLGRWIPESISDVLVEVIEPADEYDAFGTIHLMGMVLEEFPEQTTVYDASEDPSVGWALLWVTAFDAHRLHEVVVELLVELMDHAVGHASTSAVHEDFEDQLAEFDIEAFVEEYRASRDFEDEHDRPV